MTLELLHESIMQSLKMDGLEQMALARHAALCWGEGLWSRQREPAHAGACCNDALEPSAQGTIIAGISIPTSQALPLPLRSLGVILHWHETPKEFPWYPYSDACLKVSRVVTSRC